MPISTNAMRSLLSREATDPLLVLVTITHPMIEPLRICNNQTGHDIVSDGQTFTAFPFTVTFASDTDETPRARLQVANTDRRIGAALMLIAGSAPAEVRFQAVLASTPDVIEKSFARFELRNVQITPISVEGDLLQRAYGAEPWPNVRVIPSLFPALFT
jgi:hypothetical protein